MTQDVEILASKKFRQLNRYIRLEEWLATCGRILQNRLTSGYLKWGTVVLGSVPTKTFYHWISLHTKGPTCKLRTYRAARNLKHVKVIREYYSWKGGLLPFFEPLNWYEVYHRETLKSFYTEIELIYTPSDGRVWCKYQQTTAQKIGENQWTRCV